MFEQDYSSPSPASAHTHLRLDDIDYSCPLNDASVSQVDNGERRRLAVDLEFEHAGDVQRDPLVDAITAWHWVLHWISDKDDPQASAVRQTSDKVFFVLTTVQSQTTVHDLWCSVDTQIQHGRQSTMQISTGLPETGYQVLSCHGIKLYDDNSVCQRPAEVELGIVGESAFIECAASCFSEPYHQHLVDMWRKAMALVRSQSALRISDQPLYQWSQAQSEAMGLLGERCVIEGNLIDRFSSVLSRHASKTAVIDAETRLSYDELDQRSAAWAQSLSEAGVVSGATVGLALDTRHQMVVAQLAVLRVGGIFVPMDAHQPQGRLDSIVDDTRLQTIITEQSCVAAITSKLKDGAWPQLDCLVAEDLPLKPSSVVPACPATCQDTAYIIFTSGSTGKPKGVKVSHENLINFVQFMSSYVGEADISSQFAPFTFDASVAEIHSSVLNGGTLVMLGRAHIENPDDLQAYLTDQRVTFCAFPPSYAKHLRPDRLPSVRTLLTAGSAPDHEFVRLWQPHVQYINAYGPTETTILSTLWEADQIVSVDKPIVMGRPISNTQIQLINHFGHGLPPGFIGELIIGGGGVTQGYINRESTTREKFFTSEGMRWYRSGDLASLNPQGQLIFYGRADNQVKLRGHRLELGEVESALKSISGITHCAALVSNRQATAQLFVFCVGEVMDEAVLRERLGGLLPQWAMPNRLFWLDEIPLTPNGKTDYKALGQQIPATIAEVSVLHSTMSPFEREVAGLWQEVLNLPQVGAEDNFIELGGDSLTALMVASALKKFGYSIRSSLVLSQPVLRAFVAELQRQGQSQGPADALTHYAPVSGIYSLSPLQAGFAALPLDTLNRCVHALIVDCDERLDEDRFRRACVQLNQYHDMLRATFAFTDQGAMVEQRIERESPIEVTVIEAQEESLSSGKSTQDCLAGMINEIGVDDDRLIRIALLRSANRSRIVFVIHELLADRFSLSVVLADLYALYSRGEDCQQVLPAKTQSCVDWSAQQQARIRQQAQVLPVHWRERLNAQRQVQINRAALAGVDASHRQTRTVTLPPALADRLINDAVRCYRQSADDLLQCAAALSLSAACQQSTIVMDRYAQRTQTTTRTGDDLARTVGCLGGVYPQVFRADEYRALSELLMQIKESNRASIDHCVEFQWLKQCSAQQSAHQLFGGYITPEVLFSCSRLDSPASGHWRPLSLRSAGMPVSASHSTHALHIEVEILAGEVIVWTHYNPSVYEDSTIEELLIAFEQACSRIVEHCCEPMNRRWTPSDFPLLSLTRDQLEDLPQNISAAYPMTDMQKVMFHHQARYQVWMYYEFPRAFDEGAFMRAAEQLIQGYDCLRTCVHSIGRESFQVVLTDWRPPISVHQVTDGSLDAKAEELIALARQKPVRVEGEPSVAFDVIQGNAEHFLVLLSIHHINHDGWSINLLFDGLFKAYLHQLEQSPSGLTVPRATLQAVVKEQLRLAKDDELKHYWATRPWKEACCRLGSVAAPAIDHATGMKLISCQLDDSLVAGVKRVSIESAVTANVIWMAAYALMLRYLGGTEQVRFGVLHSGRVESIEGIESIAGCCVNTLPMVVDIKQGESLKAIVSLIDHSLDKMREGVVYPLSLIDALARNTIESELFETLFNIESDNYLNSNEQERPQLNGGYEATNAALNFSIIERRGRYGLRVGFNEGGLDEPFVRQVVEVYQQCVARFVDEMGSAWNASAHLYGDSSEQLLRQWNDTRTDYPAADLWSLFEQQVQRQQSREALWQQGVMSSDSISYLQLSALALQLSRRIDQVLPHTSNEGAAVAIYAERSKELVVAMLALSRLGYTYVPLDLHYPDDRLQHMIEDAHCALILTQDESTSQRLSGSHCPLLRIDDRDGALPVDRDPADISVDISPEQPAYVMYTSGSTGKPKGVLISQKSIVSLVMNNNYAPLNEQEQVLLTGAPVFDAVTYEIWGTLLHGGCLNVVAEEVLLDTEALARTLSGRAISTLWLTSSLFNRHVVEQPAMFSGVRQLLVGGDALSVEHVKLARQHNPQLCMINGYGPTENTTFSVCHRMESDLVLEQGRDIPIGKPLQNATAYIVNDVGQALPVGALGELWVGGDGVSLGYLNQPEMTQQQFVSDPFGCGEGRLYKTGDLARWRHDGVIEFAGRVDDQVKIRGFRVELGEIENRLSQHPAVREARVLLRKDDEGSGRIIAYVGVGSMVAEKLRATWVDELRAFVNTHLPDYMVPAQFVVLDQLPLNQNGKVDRHSLPEPQLQQSAETSQTDAETDTEKTLLHLLSELLGYACHNVASDFFRLGASSLDAVRFIAGIRETYAVDIGVGAIFNAGSVRELAELIDLEMADTPSMDAFDIESLSEEELDLFISQLTSEQGA